jgi:hypothetical protein
VRLLLILVSFAVVVSPRLSAQESTPVPEDPKDREFVTRFIEHLPSEEREETSRWCQKFGPECPVNTLVYYAVTMCKAIGEGKYKTRKQLLDSTGSFFKRTESEALLETAIEIICPQYRDFP